MAPAVLASRAKGGQVRTKVPNASGRHMPTYDSCLVTLTGLVLRVLPRLALRVRTRATYACLASTCWLSITLGALLSADTAGSHFYGGNTADGGRESALCFTAVSQAQRRRACVCRTRRGLRARVRAQAAHLEIGMAEGGEPAPPTSQTPSESLRPSEPAPAAEAQSAMQPLQPPVHPGQMVGAGSHALPPQSQMNLQPLQAQAPPPPSGGPRMPQPPPAQPPPMPESQQLPPRPPPCQSPCQLPPPPPPPPPQPQPPQP